MQIILAVAAGGALGSVARYLFAGQVYRLLGTDFPWGIFIVNVIGCFIMGVCAELFALRWNVTPEVRAFITVGILGGFTTFSSFSLDTVMLIERGQVAVAAAYAFASLAVSVGALFAGLAVIRSIA